MDSCTRRESSLIAAMANWSFESMYSSMVETGREVSHSTGLDGVALSDHELYVEDDETLLVMSKVKARRIGTVDLASAATGLRSSAHASIQSHQRMLECTDAVKKCMVPVEDRSSILNVDVTQMFNISGSSDSDKPYSVSEVYSDLAKEVETMYKAQVRPIKEDYKKWKLDYLYNQRQLQERRFKEGVEDVKTQSYEQAMKQAHLSWKQVSERLREDAKGYLMRTEKLVTTSMQLAAVITAHFALANASKAMQVAKVGGVCVGDAALSERIDAALLELSAAAQQKNLEVHIS